MSIFHKHKGQPYHTENSLRGIRKAARAGWDEIDLDVTMTLDGVLVNNHWDKPWKDGFRGPKLTRRTSIRKSLWADVQHWRAPGGYRINTVDRAVTECGRRHIGARLEPKADKRLEIVAVWQHVALHAKHVGARVKGYSIRNLGGRGAGVRRVHAMRAGGIPANPIR